MRPCVFSHSSTASTVSRWSGSAAACAEQSMTTAGATKWPTGIVSTELFGRSRPEIQWIGASKCVPVCSPQEKLFQYQPGPRSSYFDTSSMRKGQHWPNSGGSAICGNSGVSVCVRSMTWICPPRSAPASAPRISRAVHSAAPCGQFAFQHLRVVAPARQPFLRHVAGVHVFDAVAQRLDDGRGQRGGRDLRRRHQLVPFIVDRPGKDVDHADAGRPHLGAQALRQRMRRGLRRREGAVRAGSCSSAKIDSRLTQAMALLWPSAPRPLQRRAELLRQAQQRRSS